MRPNKFLATVAVAAITTATAGAVSASTVSDIFITSVTGEWTSITGGTNTDGLNTNAISWGTPTDAQSGYTFVGAAPPTDGPYESDDVFTLGTFTHDNFPINAGTSITEATLEVTTQGSIGDPLSPGATTFELTSTFIFDHFETPNNAVPCPGGDSGNCGDIVTPTLNTGASESINVGGTEYFISVTGFNMGASFLTAENKSNEADLLGTFTAKVPPAVPLPAAGWMLLAGVGGLAALRRRKKAA